MDGIYLINKEKDMTSHDVVNILRRKLKTRQIGHAGTLDPMATGLLVVLVGKATKLSDLLLSEKKAYSGTIKIGYSTDSYDFTGNEVSRSETFELSKREIDEAIEKIKAMETQLPPMHSAIKVNGKKLYEYARKDQTIEIQKRPITIESFECTSFKKDDFGYTLSFKSIVSKGTYIRSIANDFGQLIGIPSHLSSLNRMASGQFDLKDAYTLDEVNEFTTPSLSLEDYAKTLDEVTLSDYLSKLVRNGIRLDDRQTTSEGPVLVKNNFNVPIAIYVKDGKTYKPIIQL
ncbi:MAG TPA: tRNA pseudouridine(55) synthase TruB [Acholeplasmataceae bacterium]|nr:tRNA pseudouridine(55) synthase TruB [Acholeplasmataceae bacterium]